MSHLPSNNEKPSLEALQAQIKREQQQAADGYAKAERKLVAQKKDADYSRSGAGQIILKKCTKVASISIDMKMEEICNNAGIGAATLAPLYRRLKALPIPNLPKFDKDLKVIAPASTADEKIVDLWNSDMFAWITLVSMLDAVFTPIHGKLSSELHPGEKNRVRPDNYGLRKLIANKIQDQLAHDYIRAAYKGTGQDRIMEYILKDAYDHTAGYSQKAYNTRRMRTKKAEELIKVAVESDEFALEVASPAAEVLRWQAFTAKERELLTSKLIACVQHGIEAHLGFTMFDLDEVVSGKDLKSMRQYLKLTPQGKEYLSTIDISDLSRAFAPDVMVCQPKPHTPTSPGGYLGVAQSLIKSSFAGGFSGNFIPSEQHLRLLNAQQNIPYRVSQPTLTLLNGLLEFGNYGDRCLDKFMPTPGLSDFIPEGLQVGSKEGLNEQELEAREERRQALKGDYRKYFKALEKAKAFRTDDTMRLANDVADLERFWLPMTGGWRGRIYCSNFLLSSQGMSHQRNLLEFANGVDVDHRTKYHLQISIAGYAGQDKQTYADRVRWFIEHEEVIMDWLQDWDHILDPDSWWKNYEEMDDHLAFFNCAYEYKRLFVDNHPYRKTHVIVHRDSTASGIQFISALLADKKTAGMVNLLSTSVGVCDFYSEIIKVMRQLINKDQKRVPLRARNGDVLMKDESQRMMAKNRLEAFFRQDDESHQKIRKGIKKALLPRLYGSGVGCSIDALRENLKLHGYEGKAQYLTNEEAYALAPYFEQALSSTLPALTVFIRWCQDLVELRFNEISTHKLNGEERKNPIKVPRLDEDGNPINSLIIPTPNGSTVVEKYRNTGRQQIKVDHLTTFSVFDPRISETKVNAQKPTKATKKSKMLSATPPNIIHALDACLLAEAMDGFEGNFSLIHDSFGLSPGCQIDEVMERINGAFRKIIDSGYLEAILEANGIDPLANPVPVLGSYKTEMTIGANYMVC